MLNPSSSSDRRTELSLDDYVAGVLAGDRVILSRAITLVESRRNQDRRLAAALLDRCLPHTGQALRIGITGVPGAGKSTFIERFGTTLTGQGHCVAVLAVDPTSSRTGGSILGDKTRMERLAADAHAYIRPSPTGGSLGGVAHTTRDAMLLCEAAGFDVVLVETVGVGQSEVAVHGMVDVFLLLALTGAGDELQGIKRGIIEMADVIAINKADGDNERPAQRTRAQLQQALHLFPAGESGWRPRVVTCSALEDRGLDRIWELIRECEVVTRASGHFDRRRAGQARESFHTAVHAAIRERFLDDTDVKERYQEMEKRVVDGEISATAAAQRLLAEWP